MPELDPVVQIRLDEDAALYRRIDPAFARWTAGYGTIRHTSETQVRVHTMAERLRARVVRGEFLPTEPGEHEFACQMGMIRGKLVVQ